MPANYKSIIEEEIDRLFNHPDAARINPVTGAVNWAREPIGPQKDAAIKPLLARERFVANGPKDAPACRSLTTTRRITETPEG